MSKLFKNSGRLNKNLHGGNIGKYFLQCKDTTNTTTWIKTPHILDINNQRAIIKALLNDGIIRRNQYIVLKIGETPLLDKEYTIGALLKVIPGFIRFICKMECPDHLERYDESKEIIVCSDNKSYKNMNVLVMPYFKLGSFRLYSWINQPSRFISCLKQLFLSLYIAFIEFGFLHSDIHMDNVLIAHTNKDVITYQIKDDNIDIKTYGLRIVIMDFENAFINVDTKETLYLFRDFDRIIKDIKYAVRISFLQLSDLSMFTETKSTKSNLHHLHSDIMKLISIVDRIESIEKESQPSFIYNPAMVL